MERLRLWWPWILPPVLMLIVYRHGLSSWFQQDDFAWLLQWRQFNSWSDLPGLLFTPQAQGTIRPWSERAFFLAGYGLFGMDPRPMHALVALTQIGSLWLMASLMLRLTGSRIAAGLAPMLWVISPGLGTPMSWLSTYNQILCGFFLLAALTLFIRAAERPGVGRTWSAMGVFVLGFGALEINLVFPALATAWCLLYAPWQWKRTLPYWAVSGLYFVLHQAVAAKPAEGPYAMHWNLEMGSTLVRYFGTALAGGRTLGPWRLPEWGWAPGAWVAGIVLLAVAGAAWRKGHRTPAFGLMWFAATIGPVLPLRDHFSTYYLAIPAAGLAMAVASLLASGNRRWAIAAAAVVVVQLAFAYQVTRAAERWHLERGAKLKVLFEGLERIAQVHPGKKVLLTGMDTATYWGGFFDGPHKLLGLNEVFIAPDAAARIQAYPELGDMGPTIASRVEAARDVLWGRAVVYGIEEKALRNITRAYAKSIPEHWLETRPRMLNFSGVVAEQDLGEGWHPVEVGARWMGKRAVVYLAGPGDGEVRLRVAGYLPEVCVKDGPVEVRVWAGGLEMGGGTITAKNLSFEFLFASPEALRGRSEVAVEIEVSRTYKEPGGWRELGLHFGQIGWAQR